LGLNPTCFGFLFLFYLTFFSLCAAEQKKLDHASSLGRLGRALAGRVRLQLANLAMWQALWHFFFKKKIAPC
jgi:hypothetical protein